jgi:hypothetical protein
MKNRLRYGAVPLRATDVGAAILDADLRFVAINPELAKMNGLPVVQHYEKQLRDVLGSEARRIEIAIERVFESRTPLRNFEVRGRLPHRKEYSRWIEQYIPIHNSSGAITAVGALVVEIGTACEVAGPISDGYDVKPNPNLDCLALCEEEPKEGLTKARGMIDVDRERQKLLNPAKAFWIRHNLRRG